MNGSDRDVAYFRHLLETISALPTLPAIALKGIQLSLSPNIQMPQLLKLVRLDPPLAASLLKTADNGAARQPLETGAMRCIRGEFRLCAKTAPARDRLERPPGSHRGTLTHLSRSA